MTKGELKVAQILTTAGLRFQQEKSFDDLRGGRYRFDFYVLYNGHYVCLEYNGIQHYQQVKQFQKTRADFLKTQGHDRQKIRWALAHNIPIYCIPYWDFDKLKTIDDIFSKNYLAKSAYHNDDAWQNYRKNLK